MSRKKPKLTERAEKVLAIARDEATAMGCDYVSCGHLMLALIVEGESVGIALLQNLGVDIFEAVTEDTARPKLYELFGKEPPSPRSLGSET